ncbi:aminopeptidase P N-terminal domain-containing protein [Aquiflexum sp. LQ15W]|uniref:aminopeptidase P N-terminal domain-containing protein n=1 Tax=Cognataquiflexum nitidum TaxID=2922272 RepID=UPI001F144CBC|nr:aminopeptidase P N-terminal domain-containing protein [Cognataquiflexum nitidum]MCH6200283.1 aminopeptidase P N-terminal domain-containing protein [Cognataquiflexum nitidum]
MKFKFTGIFLFAFITFILSENNLLAQSFFDDGLSPEFHKGRREALRNLLPDNSAAVFFNNPVKNRSNDTDFTYRPNSDFYYFTGFREPNSALIVFKTPMAIDGKSVSEIIYVQPKDPAKEQWDGERLGVEGVREKLGFEHVFFYSDFLKSPAIDPKLLKSVLSFDLGEIERNSYNNPLKAMIAALKSAHSTPLKPADMALNNILERMRVIKTEEEIEIIKKAVAISGYGHMEAFRSIQPGTTERAIQGAHEFVHKAMGAEYVGYGSIVGSGNNSTILHYVDNGVVNLQEGLVLMDVGAEYRGYSGDITRTAPVKGVFSSEEKAIYEIVLKALEAGTKACTVGADFRDVDAAAREVIDEGLMKLGLVKAGERHRYFPHGVGHHLGLDVHDRGAYGTLEAGMILTVEPGIYIPEGSPVDPKWWKIGIRIEDNILITEDGNENLSEFVPRKIADIEKLMKEEGLLQKTGLPNLDKK